jgi:hypothetical protein
MATRGDGGARPATSQRWGFLGQTPGGTHSSETKPFFLTSEFLVFVLYLMGLGIAAGSSPEIDARLFWILATVALVGYMVARGLAKAGTRSRAHDPRDDLDIGRDRLTD